MSTIGLQNCNCHNVGASFDGIEFRFPNEDDKWFTSIEAAAFLGITVQALMNKASNGQIPFYKFGRRNRYRRSELERLLLKNRRGCDGN